VFECGSGNNHNPVLLFFHSKTKRRGKPSTAVALLCRCSDEALMLVSGEAFKRLRPRGKEHGVIEQSAGGGNVEL